MPPALKTSSLHSILKLDAATCIGMGVLLIAAPALLSSHTLIPQALLFWAGVALLPTAAFMAGLSLLGTIPAWGKMTVIAGNAAWAFASVALPATGLIPANTFGWAFLIGQAVVVAIFAVMEWKAAFTPLPASNN
ncbi:hypothetical protein KHP62_19250 [Rhodobacteraceae bacterium NNCM2]|nr:hypothetical protein [Coraliihabitans acroporae]